MAIQKPQKPLMVNEQEIYPVTSADQVVMDNGERLNAAMAKFLVPSYGSSDYGKILGCSADGLQWVDTPAELPDVEEAEF